MSEGEAVSAIVTPVSSSARGDGLDPVVSIVPEDFDVEGARVCLRIIANANVDEATLGRLPATPRDWSGLARRLHVLPPKKRETQAKQYLDTYNHDQRSQAIMRRAFEIAKEEPEPVADPPKPRRMKLIGASELAHTDYTPEWLVEGVLVARQPCLIGAPKKGMKTSMAIDLGVSIASGLHFLGEFAVPKPVTTIIISGESGGSAIQSTTQRVCHSKGIRVADLEGRYYVGFELPRLSDDEDLKELAELIQEVNAGVVIIDPLYLCLASGSSNGRQIDMANLFQVGPLLLAVAKTCLDAGATPILIHHNKLTGGDPDGKPELGNLAFAGIQEFARQWVLLARRSRFVPGSGKHELWLTVGGSIGHSGEWAVDVHEGTMERDFSGRTWEVTVKTNGDAIAEEKADKQAQARTKAAEAEVSRSINHHEHEDKILAALRQLGGQASRSKTYGAAKLNASNGTAALARLEADGRIEPCQLVYPKGTGQSNGPGVRIVEPRQTPTNPD